MIFRILILLFSGIIFLANNALGTQTEPDSDQTKKWQLGLGLGSEFLADYRGSSYYQIQFIPIPFVIYNGEYIKIDRDGARGEYHWSDQLEFNVSADAALNGDSTDNPLRLGMPDLNSAFEIGPSVNWAFTPNSFEEGWSLRLPLRSVYTLGSEGFGHQGYVFNPKLTWRKSLFDHWVTSVHFGPLWASQEYHDYYYSVAAPYALESRPEYKARAGYSGFMTKVSMKRNFGHYWLGAFIRTDFLNDAVFLDSPLIEEKTSASIGLAAVYLFN
jgi:MipA family protein